MGGSWYINEIIIDSNEKVRGYNAYVFFDKTHEVHVDPLDYGDYLFRTKDSKEVIFEFKTCKDFISSMENKSLFQELSNQTMNNEYSYLIVCGNFNKSYEELYFESKHHRYKYKTPELLKSRLSKQVEGALHRIYAMYIPVIFVETEDEAFNEMLKISSKIGNVKKYGGVVRPSVKDLEQNPVEFFLTGIKGIGEKRAEEIVNELGLVCLDDLCRVKPSDFLSLRYVKTNNVKDIWMRVHNEELVL